MPITLTMTYESTDDMLRDLAALVRLTGFAPTPAAPEVMLRDPFGQPLYNSPGEPEAVEPPLPNGPVVQFPEVKLPTRRGRPPKSEVASQASAQPESEAVVTPDDCIEAVKSLVSRTGDILAPGHVLGGFGVKKTRELTDAQRAGFVAACAAYVAEGAKAAP
jgi:hypothetical protein